MSNGEASCLTESFGERESEIGIVRRLFVVTELGAHIQGHTHPYDHDMVVYQGECDVELWTGAGENLRTVHLKAFDTFTVHRDIFHKITPTVVPYAHSCDFLSRHEDGAVAGAATGWRGASDATRDPLPIELAR